MMQLISFSGVMDAVNHSKNRAMEADTISKHGRSSKSQMSRRNNQSAFFWLFPLSIIVLMMFSSCATKIQMTKNSTQYCKKKRKKVSNIARKITKKDTFNSKVLFLLYLFINKLCVNFKKIKFQMFRNDNE